MTDAIEAGARALVRDSWYGLGIVDGNSLSESGEYDPRYRTAAKACIEAAIASGALVPASAVAEMRDGSIDRVAEAIAVRAIERGHPIKPVVVRHIAVAAIDAIRQIDLAPASGEYVVVPRTPTDAMISAGCKTLGWTNPKDEAGRDDVTGVYRVMLHAASSNGGEK